MFARIIAEHLQEAWGQPVVVEPRPGGGGKIAVSSVTSAPPDGHTLLFATPTFTLATAMKLATYDFAKDLEPAALIGLIAYAMVVNPTVPANSVADLVALAKAKPGEINCASAGNGTVPHLACETFNKAAGVQVVHVPFRDVNSAMMGTVGGHVQMFVAVSTVAKQQIAGRHGARARGHHRAAFDPAAAAADARGVRLPELRHAGLGRTDGAGRHPQGRSSTRSMPRCSAPCRSPRSPQKLLGVGMEPPPPMAADGVRHLHQGRHRALDRAGRCGRAGEAAGIASMVATSRSRSSDKIMPQR